MPPIRPEYLPPTAIPKNGVLAVVAFGEEPPAVDALAVTVPIPQLGERVVEVWRVDGEVSRESREGVSIARTDEVLFGTIRVDGPSDTIAATAYDSIVAAARGAGYPHLWRIWNHVGGINESEDGLERYKRFSAGRYQSLTRHGYARERFPAASAVGMSEAGLLVYFVAGRTEGRQAENPRQVSAYDYPPQYGPRSPSFSRATVIGDDLIFVSGTASVVGHESVHPDSVERQLRETVENLDVTISAAAAIAGREATASDLTVAKIYVRSASADDDLTGRLQTKFSSSMVLRSDICRRELLLEIEGVVVLPRR